MTEKWNVFKTRWKELWRQFFYYCCIPSLFCYTFVELCSRKSILDLGMFFLEHPFVFLYNALIIAATASACLLFKRRVFVLSVVLFLWAAVGVTDMIMLSFRTTPFTAVDLRLINDALKIMNRYLSPFLVVLIIAAVVGVVAFCVYLFIKAKKEEGQIDYILRVPFCVLLVMLCLTLTDAGMAIGFLDRNFGNLAQAFHDNGLPYCFMSSILNTGVEKPDNYSSEEIEQLAEELEQDAGKEIFISANTVTPKATVTPEPTKSAQPTPSLAPEADGEEKGDYPNIIFLQLESFFDVKYIENSSYTKDPVEFFTYLKENYPSGFLSVPSVGAGTANTEFECITGMNLDFFGPGEYPYKTILKKRTCESLAYNLKKLGYSTAALHNNDGTFYDRNNVFANLGFDRFVSIEYMAEAEVNELNWARDSVLTGEIMKVLQKTEGPDYIYTISVQGHGAYPEEPLLENPVIDVKLPEELSDYYYQYLYYVNQIYEMDLFLKDLILNLNAWQEDVVLVLYGDHLPSLGLEEGLLKNGDLFQTEYVIWTNFELNAIDKDLEAYQLSSRVMELLGLKEGIMVQYHQYRYEDEEYLENMQLLMYDMLYGDMEVYGGVNPYERTNLIMGVDEISIEKVYLKKSTVTKGEPILYISGENFTEWSKIAVNGDEIETIYVNQNLLAATEFPMDNGKVYQITVRQQGSDEEVLSETESYEFVLE